MKGQGPTSKLDSPASSRWSLQREVALGHDRGGGPGGGCVAARLLCIWGAGGKTPRPGRLAGAGARDAVGDHDGGEPVPSREGPVRALVASAGSRRDGGEGGRSRKRGRSAGERRGGTGRNGAKSNQSSRDAGPAASIYRRAAPRAVGAFFGPGAARVGLGRSFAGTPPSPAEVAGGADAKPSRAADPAPASSIGDPDERAAEGGDEGGARNRPERRQPLRLPHSGGDGA